MTDVSPVRRGRPRIARTPVRSEVPHSGDRQVVGRDGEVLTRMRTGNTDPFFIDQKWVEKGWTMQWLAMSVVGNKEVVQDQLHGMHQNGWRPVPASRFPGRFMPADTPPETHITRGGQGLFERPLTLTEEARAEDIMIARQQVMDRDAA